MSEISANQIKELREKTGAGVLDCKKALVESGGDLEKAVDILRKSGAAKADKKSGRITAEGRVAAKIEGSEGVLLEVNCETDFVAKTDDFQNFVDALAAHALKTRPANLEALLDSSLNGQKVKETVQNLIAKTGENLSVRRFTLVSAGAGEKLGSYIHMGNKIGVIVKAKGPQDQLSEGVLRDVAMHVAASSPQYLSPEKIPAEALEREKAIYKEQMKDMNKPPQVLEKILDGKIARFADEVCLLQQIFVKDPTGKQSVSQYLKQIHPEITVVDFFRYQVGEGIAKREDNFAEEVAKTRG
ncbi:MAG: translation elongation factor Ts [bacterium]